VINRSFRVVTTLEMLAWPSGTQDSSLIGVRFEVTRHHLLAQPCGHCGHVTQAQLATSSLDSQWRGVQLSERRLLGPSLAATLVYADETPWFEASLMLWLWVWVVCCAVLC
jgi:hypothetical protein